jgi:hypothetical protein
MAIPPGLFRDPEHYRGLSPEELEEVLGPEPLPRRSGGWLVDPYDAILFLGVASLFW